MANPFKDFIESQKAKTQISKEADIANTFDIAVKEDTLWIIHDGYGIKEIEPETTAREIVEILNNFKKTAIKYK